MSKCDRGESKRNEVLGVRGKASETQRRSEVIANGQLVADRSNPNSHHPLCLTPSSQVTQASLRGQLSKDIAKEDRTLPNKRQRRMSKENSTDLQTE